MLIQAMTVEECWAMLARTTSPAWRVPGTTSPISFRSA